MIKHTTRTQNHRRDMSSEGTSSQEIDVSGSSGRQIIIGLEQREWSKCEGDGIIDLKKGEIAVRSGLRRD